MKAFDIVGYTYQADNYHPECVVKVMVTAGDLSPAALDMRPEEVLDQHAGAIAIDREDEHSFDSGEFPKVIFAVQVESDEDTCGRCTLPLIGD